MDVTSLPSISGNLLIIHLKGHINIRRTQGIWTIILSIIRFYYGFLLKWVFGFNTYSNLTKGDRVGTYDPTGARILVRLPSCGMIKDIVALSVPSWHMAHHEQWVRQSLNYFTMVPNEIVSLNFGISSVTLISKFIIKDWKFEVEIIPM